MVMCVPNATGDSKVWYALWVGGKCSRVQMQLFYRDACCSTQQPRQKWKPFSYSVLLLSRWLQCGRGAINKVPYPLLSHDQAPETQLWFSVWVYDKFSTADVLLRTLPCLISWSFSLVLTRNYTNCQFHATDSSWAADSYSDDQEMFCFYYMIKTKFHLHMNKSPSLKRILMQLNAVSHPHTLRLKLAM
jgi:hypothetical protein